MALDLRVRKAGEDIASTSSPTTKQVLNVPKVAPLPKLTLPTTTDHLPSLALSLGIPLAYPPTVYTQSAAGGGGGGGGGGGLSDDCLANLNLQPLSVAEESALQRELNKLKDDWTRYRTEMSTPRSRRFDGSRGVGWTTVGNIIVPYIMRGPSKYVSTKIVEAKLLSTLQGVNLEKMSHAGPLYSYYITEQEARLFTEINTKCYSQQFGPDPFTTQDLIVNLAEFERFYNNMRKQCGVKQEPDDGSSSPPNSSVVSMPPLIQDFNDTSIEGVEGGWLQINNTVVPYVFRNGVKFVPLCVIKYAAGLLTDVRIDGYKTPCTEMEYQYLNSACRQHGVNFSFLKSTKFIKLELVIRLSNWKVTIKELPTDDPFMQASYQHDVREPLLGFPVPSSPDLAPNQNPALFQIPCPLSLPSSSSGADAFQMLTTPVTAIASHALQFFNAAAGSSNLLLPCFPPDPVASSSASSAPDPSIITTSSAAAAASAHVTPPTAPPPVIVVAPTTTTNPVPSLPSLPSKILSDPTKKLPTFSKRPGRSSALSTSTTSRGFSSSAVSSHPIIENYVAAASSQIGQPNKIVIECKEFQKKTLPCLLRGGVPENSFVLVESVMRLYFPQVGLDQFIDVLQAVMDVSIVHLRSVEEQAFIRFYNLPVKAMRYKYMMMFQDLQRTYFALQDYFTSGVLSKSSMEHWSDHKGKSSLTNGHSTKHRRKSKSPPKLPSLEKNVKLESGNSPVCYVMDNTVVGEQKLNDGLPTDSSSGSDSDECVNLEEERCALMTAYCAKDTDSDESTKRDTKESVVDESKLDIGDHSPKHVDTGDTEQSSSHSKTETKAKSDSEAEEKIDVEAIGGYDTNKENNVHAILDSDSKDSDKNHNDVESVGKADSPSLKRCMDDGDDSPAVPEKRNKASNVKKLESALAKLKQRQQEKLVAVEEPVT